jgi:hypothetical protein
MPYRCSQVTEAPAAAYDRGGGGGVRIRAVHIRGRGPTAARVPPWCFSVMDKETQQ